MLTVYLFYNEVIGHLGLLKLSLKGGSFTWSNMQDNPLLEQLGLVLYFGQLDFYLSHDQGSAFGTQITCLEWFPFSLQFLKLKSWSENYWIEKQGFFNAKTQQKPFRKGHIPTIIAHKFKSLRLSLIFLQKVIYRIKSLIEKYNTVILVLVTFEGLRLLYRLEFNF